MRLVAAIVMTIALAIAGLYVAVQLVFPTHTYRYRLTIEAEVDGQVKSGSGVIEAVGKEQPRLGDVSGAVGLRGDAVFVDLGRAGHVIAVLALGPKGDNVDGPIYLGLQAFKARGSFGAPFDGWDEVAKMTGRRAELEPELIPTLVTFANLEDPKTARVVRPNEFEAVFGPGVRFKRAIIEITNDPVTRGVEKKLPLIKLLRQDAKVSRIHWIGDPFRASSGQFERGR